AGGSPEIGRIHERRAGGVQFGDESICTTPNGSLEGTCGREIGRARTSGNIRVSGRIRGDTLALVLVVSAEIGRIHERRAVCVQLGDESVVITTAAGGLEGTCGREISRFGKSRHISVSGRIHGYTIALVVAVSA